MCAFPEGIKIVFESANIAQFKSIVESKNETIKFRGLDLFAGVAGQSLPAFQMCETAGFLKAIVATFQTDDILQQMNTIELLDKVQ
jgi:hypothetical protein